MTIKLRQDRTVTKLEQKYASTRDDRQIADEYQWKRVRNATTPSLNMQMMQVVNIGNLHGGHIFVPAVHTTEIMCSKYGYRPFKCLLFWHIIALKLNFHVLTAIKTRPDQTKLHVVI